MNNINQDPLLTTEESAEYLNKNPRTLTNYRCNGDGPKFIRLGRQIRYKKSSLDAYINQSEVK